ncbi:MAG: hypothetical protein PHE89_05195 [Alphaproteobacteria bacterium]|nr:hypothetical protein [Alphaproteobacteria bacterium]
MTIRKNIIKIEQENFELLKNDEIECFLLANSLPEAFVKSFKKQAESLDKIVLAEGEAFFMQHKAFFDGLIVDLSKSEAIKDEMQNLRETVGKETFLGVISRPRRHEAMIVSENEPDFIVFKVWCDGFERQKELLDWYGEFFLIQQAAYLMDDDIELSQVSSDIIILNEKNFKILVDKKQSLD